MRRRVLVITSLFGLPWDPTRAMFNQQQFDRLAQRVDLTVLVAVPWTSALSRPLQYWRAGRAGRARWPYVDYFIFWHIPGAARSFHIPLFIASLLLQRLRLVFLRRWDVLFGSWGHPDAAAVGLIGQWRGVPTLAKVHGSDVNLYSNELRRGRQLVAGLARCDRVFAVSAALASRLVQIGVPAARVQLNYNGVDTARFRPQSRVQARSALGVPAAAQVVLFIGNLLPAKGAFDLLEAFARLAQWPQLQLVYVGDGPARDGLVGRAAALGLADRVRLAGKIPHAELPAWLAAAHLLCLPSHNEGVPNVVLEAMACGVPVVATRVGGIPEVVPEVAGLLVPPRDSEALRRALEIALGRSWDHAAISAHAAMFSWQANIDRTCEAIEAVLAARGAAGAPAARPAQGLAP